jgi:hypothetical protein
MVVLASNDKKELQKDIAKAVKDFPHVQVGEIKKCKDGWYQVIIHGVQRTEEDPIDPRFQKRQ